MQTTNPRAQYIAQMRSRTAYPTFRGIMNVFLFLNYGLAALYVLGGLFSAVAGVLGGKILIGVGMVLGGLLAAAILVVITKVIYEASMMLADIADSLLDQNAPG
jgi:hypothetical protein